MSLIPGRAEVSAEEEPKLAAQLVRSCGLSEDDVEQVLELCQLEELRFAEAALRLGLVTQTDIDAAQRGLQAPPPKPAAKPGAELRIAHDPFDVHSDKVRALRNEILLRQQDRDANCFAVLSAGAGDGRSRLAAELAIALAQLDEPTLLIDADLRKPRQHLLFNAVGDYGLAEALASDVPPRLQEVSGLPALQLLAAGGRTEHPLELLTGEALRQLLAGLQRQYRHIVLDTAPAAQYSDAYAVAAQAGAVLLAIRQDRTRLADSRELTRRLASTRAQTLGVAVLNF